MPEGEHYPVHRRLVLVADDPSVGGFGIGRERVSATTWVKRPAGASTKASPRGQVRLRQKTGCFRRSGCAWCRNLDVVTHSDPCPDASTGRKRPLGFPAIVQCPSRLLPLTDRLDQSIRSAAGIVCVGLVHLVEVAVDHSLQIRLHGTREVAAPRFTALMHPRQSSRPYRSSSRHQTLPDSVRGGRSS